MAGLDGSEHGTARRPLATRKTKWAAAVARWLAAAGVRPNTLSVLSMVCAGGAGGCMVMAGRVQTVDTAVLLVLSAVLIQLRLLCNLFDGMVAIEGGRQTPSGEIYNDFPDRVSDLLILVAAGYAIPDTHYGPVLGWVAGTLALLTAYIRVLGGSAGVAQRFIGPMAKQHRMAAMTAGVLIAAVFVPLGRQGLVLQVAMAVIILGSLATLVRRFVVVIRVLESE